MEIVRPEPFDDGGALLALLLDEPTVHWSFDELERQMGWLPDRLEDVLAELDRDGLIHRRGGAVWPTRAAVRCRTLLT
jgi:DNA-binding HxlR family transcriptional regulator